MTAVDAESRMLAVAAAEADRHGIGRIEFAQADLSIWTPDRTYDAVVGRLVLVHLPDPIRVVRRLAASVRPGGVVVFSDFVISAARQEPAGPLFTATLERAIATFRAAGRPVDMGLELGRVLREAGLPAPQWAIGGAVQEGPDAPAYGMLADVTRSLLPLIVRLGIAEDGAVEVATLEQRLRDEARALGGPAGAVVMPPPLVTAWSRVVDAPGPGG